VIWRTGEEHRVSSVGRMQIIIEAKRKTTKLTYLEVLRNVCDGAVG
jgi:hypothetical protein